MLEIVPKNRTAPVCSRFDPTPVLKRYIEGRENKFSFITKGGIRHNAGEMLSIQSAYFDKLYEGYL